MSDQSSRTEKPTPQRLDKARKEGRFASSKEFVSAFQFIAFVTLLGSYTGEWFSHFRAMIRFLLEQAFHAEFGVSQVVGIANVLLRELIWPLLYSGAIIALVSLAIHLVITRFGFSFSRLAFDPSKLDPIKKARDTMKQGLPAITQAMFMLVAFSFILYRMIRDDADLLFFLPLARPEAGVRQVAMALMNLLWKAAALFGVLGAVDLFRQLRKFQKEMRMSKQDIKDEQKQSEGDPQIKMRIRRIQRDMRRKRMMNEIATATAVIVNPTHFAVAIRYKHDEMATPVVVAKGKNYLALRIRQKAIENQVPLIENPPLAQALYKSVEVGQEIPPHLYRAVAEILAYIYHLMERQRGGPERSFLTQSSKIH